jgi:hypothetical protein
VRLKLKGLHSEIEAGVRAPASYTVQAAVDDWLAQGLTGRSRRTLTLYRNGVKPLTDRIGARRLRKLTAREVRSALVGRSGDTLPWRIVLTSRENAWNGQITVREGSSSHRSGQLRPLAYPGDVEPFIHRWFAQRPAWGIELADQIARRPGLQQAAAVPLILAYFCIVGGGEPLPEYRPPRY